ncbi:hypothetical protein EV361DRAFT_792407 [Lentinula raphanica]|uniref:YCII-related domain-containing protein n=1 Tax=Lentinula raphanica TaxID=153919 RepID=A0AA38PGB5_9AGAR|nr:hypothetical protein EV360DRAFT_37066 [Lentinula raphanica]KAJ3842388.1 hypothetical protein F5878DRAFT_529902 [Lentinula raphanica]KAJ3975394.1 hypothetical protein EV361DRAFT_792407 [Lentinula raphanica]
MSTTTTAKLHKFVLFAPDAKDSGRSAVQKQHREAMAPFVQSGVVKVAGMTITPESIEYEDATVKPFGSCIIYEAESIDVVRKMVESDIYYTSGVWDREKLVLVPFLPVTSFP